MLKSNNSNIKIENIIEQGTEINTRYELTEDSYKYILPNVKNTTLEDVLQQLRGEVERNGMQDSIVDFLKSVLDSAFGEFNSIMDYLNIIQREIEFDQEEIRKKIDGSFGTIVRQHADSKYQYLIDLDSDPNVDDFKAEGEEEEFYNEDGTLNQWKYGQWLINGGYEFSKSDIVSFLNTGHVMHIHPLNLMDVLNDVSGHLNPFDQLIVTFGDRVNKYGFYLNDIILADNYWSDDQVRVFEYIDKLISEERGNDGYFYPYKYTTKNDLVINLSGIEADEFLISMLRSVCHKWYLGQSGQPEDEPVKKNKSRVNEELLEQLDKISDSIKALQINMIDLVDVINNTLYNDK